mmetsp:Transcript_24514/g.51518  ORF Transcript_24514/g.51518 Transcript_24514/m.51518 type:complete len:294 (-) Transcript_24514:744-1625(-)
MGLSNNTIDERFSLRTFHALIVVIMVMNGNIIRRISFATILCIILVLCVVVVVVFIKSIFTPAIPSFSLMIPTSTTIRGIGTPLHRHARPISQLPQTPIRCPQNAFHLVMTFHRLNHRQNSSAFSYTNFSFVGASRTTPMVSSIVRIMISISSIIMVSPICQICQCHTSRNLNLLLPQIRPHDIDHEGNPPVIGDQISIVIRHGQVLNDGDSGGEEAVELLFRGTGRRRRRRRGGPVVEKILVVIEAHHIQNGGNASHPSYGRGVVRFVGRDPEGVEGSDLELDVVGVLAHGR